MATQQELFDQVVTGLLTQKVPSKIFVEERKASICAYRGAEGRKCSAGLLITDEEYQPWMDTGLDFHDIMYDSRCPASMYERLKPHQPTVTALQNIHDNLSPDDWEGSLKVFAKANGLQFNPPKE